MSAPRIGDWSPSDVNLWMNLWNDDGQAHVVPDFGPAHELSMRCWCHPGIDTDTEAIVTHNVGH